MAIANIVCPGGTVVGIDRDPNAIEIAKKSLSRFGDCITCLHGNFAELDRLLGRQYAEGFDGILMDLGFSSMQIDDANRGFSFLRESALDMRMDRSSGASAEILVNEFSEEELGRIFREYGEERWWKRIARAITEKRKQHKIMTTTELAAIVEKVVPYGKSRRAIHPATRIFQALRIAVNNELSNLEIALPVAFERLKKGGRLIVISYHSLEDRIAKKFFVKNAKAAYVLQIFHFVYAAGSRCLKS